MVMTMMTTMMVINNQDCILIAVNAASNAEYIKSD